MLRQRNTGSPTYPSVGSLLNSGFQQGGPEQQCGKELVGVEVRLMGMGGGRGREDTVGLRSGVAGGLAGRPMIILVRENG